MSKTNPCIKHLAVLNRNLHNRDFYDSLPKRLQLSPSLIIDEFVRFFPQNVNIMEKASEFVRSSIIDIDGLQRIQSQIRSKKAKSDLFMKTKVSALSIFCSWKHPLDFNDDMIVYFAVYLDNFFR